MKSKVIAKELNIDKDTVTDCIKAMRKLLVIGRDVKIGSLANASSTAGAESKARGLFVGWSEVDFP